MSRGDAPPDGTPPAALRVGDPFSSISPGISVDRLQGARERASREFGRDSDPALIGYIVSVRLSDVSQRTARLRHTRWASENEFPRC